MQKRKIVILISNLVLALGIAATTPAALAATPSTLNYHGELGNAAGVPVNAAVSITFSLYDVATGGAAVWTETQMVTVVNGFYNVTLGQPATLLTPALFGVPLYLGITVGADAEMTPRTPLSSSATSMRAAVAESVSCTGCLTATQFAPGAVAAAIPTGSITATQLAAGVATVPAGAIMMTNSTTPPAGYTYLGAAPSTEAWTYKAYMPTARTNVAVAVVNNKLYAIGGADRVDAIDPVTGTPIALLDFPLSVNEVYDPATNTWATKAPMPTARHTHSATAIGGKIYVVGGQIATIPPVLNPPLPGVYADTAVNEEYDPVADTWVTKAPMPTVRRNVSAGTIAGKLYALGGRGPNGVGGVRTVYATNEEYDPVANTWVTKAPMSTARRSLGVAVANNKLYAMGGRADNQVAPNFTTLYNVNEEYDPLTNTWVTKAPMPENRTGFAAETINGKIYAVGGWGFYNNVDLTTSVEYDPATNQWTVRQDLPAHRSGLAGAAGVINNKLYVVGGDQTDPVNGLTQLLPYCQEYDPGTPLFMHVKQ